MARTRGPIRFTLLQIRYLIVKDLCPKFHRRSRDLRGSTRAPAEGFHPGLSVLRPLETEWTKLLGTPFNRALTGIQGIWDPSISLQVGIGKQSWIVQTMELITVALKVFNARYEGCNISHRALFCLAEEILLGWHSFVVDL